MRLTRHARNRMRLYDLRRGDIAQVMLRPTMVGHDERGNTRLVGQASGRTICVVMAADDPGLIITVFETDA